MQDNIFMSFFESELDLLNNLKNHWSVELSLTLQICHQDWKFEDWKVKSFLSSGQSYMMHLIY